MQGIQSVAAGLLALLSSAALAAELPVVKQVEADQGGCLYTFKVLDDSASGSFEYPSGPPGWKNGKYKLVVEVGSIAASCAAQPRSVEVAKSFEVPDIAIQASDAGLAVAYTRGSYHPWTNYTRFLNLKQLSPVNLGVQKAVEFSARYGSQTTWTFPGQLSVSELTLSNGSVEVSGSLVGNYVWGGGATQAGTGENYVISYLDFLGQPQQGPSIVIY